MRKKSYIDVEIDKLTNSIVNVLSGDVLQTEFHSVTKKEIKKKDWLFDWGYELAQVGNEVYKMTIVENQNIIQGLISFYYDHNEKYIFVNLVENAKFNRGKGKIYVGVGGNLFAFACKRSREIGYGGFIAFNAKTALMEYYASALGAQRALGNRMFNDEVKAKILIEQYFSQ